MVDGGERVRDAAIRELAEEVGGNLEWCPPVLLAGPLLVSPGSTDERAFIYVCHARASFEQLEQLDGAAAGNAEEGEHITTRVVPLSGAREALLTDANESDMKSTLALSLYR
jgi:8-oxo-dGTP pyrophosphatase MutT (NUDIX family)